MFLIFVRRIGKVIRFLLIIELISCEIFKLAESMRKDIQGDRFEELPDSGLSYAMISFHAFW